MEQRTLFAVILSIFVLFVYNTIVAKHSIKAKINGTNIIQQVDNK